MHVVRAPGRVNLIGDHTDYQQGFCLPVPLALEVEIAFALGTDVVELASSDLGGTARLRVRDGAGANAHDAAPPWADTIAEAIRLLGPRHGHPRGLRGEIRSTVPIGAGLSSSAAFTIAVIRALEVAGGWDLEDDELIVAAREIEERATGVPCGFLDQTAIVKGRRGCALLLDCRDRSTELVPIPASIDLAVVHSGVTRTLAGGEYAARRAECERIAARLGVAALRDASEAMVADEPRARHVVSENARVLRFAAALAAGDVEMLGALMIESHRSLRDDFAVSTPELDTLVELLVEHGADGARLTGAGFGGCVVAVAPAGDLEEITRRAGTAYHARTGLETTTWQV